MSTERIERRLAAILSADVVGYSRLMEADETGTLARLEAHRREFTHPKITEHHGRIVKLMGDGALVEFASVVDAVQCAVEVQQGMAERNANVPPDERIEFRVGINVGDIIVRGDDIYGDGVNIAARLEQVADPGGVCISGEAFRQARGKVEVGFEDLGPQQVKNIEQPVAAYRVLLAPEVAGTVIERPGTKLSNRLWRWAAPVAAVVVVIGIAAGVLLTLEPWAIRVEAADRSKMAYPLPDKPSIAVMPFENLSGDKEQDYLADGITDTIITALSQTEQMFVIARDATFAYKGKPATPKEVAEAFGVGNVLEGSFQKSGERVRISVRLIDALSGRQLWAGRYDRPMADIFAMQDDITGTIVEELQIKLTIGEQGRIWRKGTSNAEAYQLSLKSWDHFVRFTPEDNAMARSLAEQAIAADPKFAGAYVVLGWTFEHEWVAGLAKDPDQAYAKARETAEKAIAVDDNYSGGHALLAWIYVQKGEHAKALAEAEKAVALEPGGAGTASISAMVLVQSGRPEEAIEWFKRVERLQPNLPAIYYWTLSEALRQLGRFDEMVPLAKSIVEKVPTYWWEYPRLVYAYMEMGQPDEAKKWLHVMLDGHPERAQAWLAGVSPLPAEAEKKFVSALVKAGFPMPESSDAGSVQ